MIQRQGQQTNTVEGAVSGARAAQLDKERDAQIAAFESAKKELANASSRILPKNVNDKFSKSTRNSAKPNTLGTAQYGLTTLDQYRRAQSGQVDQDKTEKVDDDAIAKAEAKATESRKRAAKKRKASSSFLSFGGGDDDSSSSDDDDDDEDTTATKDGANAASASSSTSSSASSSASASNKRSKLICKNPDIDTSFLPDRDRRVLEESKRNALKKEYELHQSQLKQQLIEITYSWWDGSGHRRVIQVPQGTTILQFLELCRVQLIESNFPNLKKMSADQLIYIKEDLIIPGDYTFYDLIKTKARGKSGPLFHFDVHEDLRVGLLDSRVEKDESHPGKIVDRSWFERNKHIFPANRWEIYDPSVDYGGYTIHGSEVR